jgi:uncharacterized membrane protein
MELLKTKHRDTNVSDRERLASMVGGAALAAFGLMRRNPAGYGLAALGGVLLYRGYTGHCDAYRMLGVNTADRGYSKGTGMNASVPYELGLRVDHEIVVNKPVAEVYRFWRQFENLPRFMEHLHSVTERDNRRSHWVAKGPIGMDVDWDAEIIHEEENKQIGWRSLEGSDVDNAGSVHFESTPEGHTRVHVHLQYNPPAGALGAAIARLFGENPKKQIREDMQRFKELMETGNVRRKVTVRKDSTNASPGELQGKRIWDRDKVTESSQESFPASDPPSWTPEAV